MINFNGSLTHIPGKKWDLKNADADKSFCWIWLSERMRLKQISLLANTAISSYITNPNEEIADPKLFGIDALSLKTSFCQSGNGESQRHSPADTSS